MFMRPNTQLWRVLMIIAVNDAFSKKLIGRGQDENLWTPSEDEERPRSKAYRVDAHPGLEVVYLMRSAGFGEVEFSVYANPLKSIAGYYLLEDLQYVDAWAKGWIERKSGAVFLQVSNDCLFKSKEVAKVLLTLVDVTPIGFKDREKKPI